MFDTKTDMIRKLAYFVSERENILYNKVTDPKQKKPWTEDEILKKYRFCNIHRRDDRVSAWIVQNIIIPYKEHEWLWIMLCIARYINWPPTIQDIMDKGEWPVESFSATAFGEIIDKRMKRGKKTWTGAYLITGRNIPKDMGKGYFIAKNMVEPLFSNETIPHYLTHTMPKDRSIEEVLGLFKGVYGWGTFMAGQAVADMTYCHLLDKAKDLYTFAPIGPGSTRGLNRIYGRTLEQIAHQDTFNEELIDTLEIAKGWATIDLSTLTLHDWQNCMCEFDKYIRASNGGRPRSNYTPETSF